LEIDENEADPSKVEITHSPHDNDKIDELGRPEKEDDEIVEEKDDSNDQNAIPSSMTLDTEEVLEKPLEDTIVSDSISGIDETFDFCNKELVNASPEDQLDMDKSEADPSEVKVSTPKQDEADEVCKQVSGASHKVNAELLTQSATDNLNDSISEGEIMAKDVPSTNVYRMNDQKEEFVKVKKVSFSEEEPIVFTEESDSEEIITVHEISNQDRENIDHAMTTDISGRYDLDQTIESDISDLEYDYKYDYQEYRDNCNICNGGVSEDKNTHQNDGTKAADEVEKEKEGKASMWPYFLSACVIAVGGVLLASLSTRKPPMIADVQNVVENMVAFVASKVK